MTYEVIDKRGNDSGKIQEVCRVCGCVEKVHTTVYNEPTMDCIHFLRNMLQGTTAEIVRLMQENESLEKEINELRSKDISQNDEIEYLRSQIESLEARLDHVEIELDNEREKNYAN